MPLAFAAIGLGVLFLVSGLKGKSLQDVFTGNTGTPLNPAGGQGKGIALFTPTSSPTTESGSAPTGTETFDGKPVAAWIVPILKWARDNGWTGRVSSGYRTAAEQDAAARRYGLEHYSGDPQSSNHRSTTYPGGAVDVSNAAQLNRVLQKYNGHPTLVWAGPIIGDQVHFSANGH